MTRALHVASGGVRFERGLPRVLLRAPCRKCWMNGPEVPHEFGTIVHLWVPFGVRGQPPPVAIFERPLVRVLCGSGATKRLANNHCRGPRVCRRRPLPFHLHGWRPRLVRRLHRGDLHKRLGLCDRWLPSGWAPFHGWRLQEKIVRRREPGPRILPWDERRRAVVQGLRRPRRVCHCVCRLGLKFMLRLGCTMFVVAREGSLATKALKVVLVRRDEGRATERRPAARPLRCWISPPRGKHPTHRTRPGGGFLAAAERAYWKKF